MKADALYLVSTFCLIIYASSSTMLQIFFNFGMICYMVNLLCFYLISWWLLRRKSTYFLV